MMEWIKRWGPAIFFMAVIFLFSATPGKELPVFGGWDLLAKKGGHMLGYAILASSYYYAVARNKIPSPIHFILALCMAVLYACSDEFHQSFVPGRSPSLIDVGIDTAGGFFGLIAFCIVRRKQSAQQADAKAGAE
jgi:VanZ family protein